MKVLRTPDERFASLPGYDFEPHYLHVKDAEAGELRVHYIDEGPREGRPVLLLHGEPTWSYLYRKMIRPLADAGFRVLAPDLIGFGRSDKLPERGDYTYTRHLDWIQQTFDALQIEDVVLFCQDWGGLLGLRLVAAQPEKFAGVVAGNTMLPTGDHDPGQGFLAWQKFSQETPHFPVGKIIQSGLATQIDAAIVAAYDAPFPDDSYKAAARQFPMLVPTTPDNPESEPNRQAWEVLKQFDKPFLTCFSDKDPVTRGGDRVMQKLIPGCDGQKHVTVENGGHFLQEDQGELLAQLMIDFMRDNKLA